MAEEHQPESETELVDSVDEKEKTQEPARAILFNDDVHTFDEVIAQIIKAIRCDYAKAEALTWEVHNNGKACVFTGELNKCLEVTRILEEIELMTQIEL